VPGSVGPAEKGGAAEGGADPEEESGAGSAGGGGDGGGELFNHRLGRGEKGGGERAAERGMPIMTVGQKSPAKEPC
jgi:hypothetical protein